MVEGLCNILSADNQAAAEAHVTLSGSVELMTYGGAALAPHCSPLLKRGGFVLMCTYGQTELAGPVMYGKPGGHPNALRPMHGVDFELMREDGEEGGELVLLGNASSTAGYLQLSKEPREYRSLTGGDAIRSTAERFHTADLFVTVDANSDGKIWLLYDCRKDDILVHTSGEMTNPLCHSEGPNRASRLAPPAPIVSLHASTGVFCMWQAVGGSHARVRLARQG